MKTLQIVLSVSLLTALPLRAQVVNDGETNILSNVTNTITGDVTVGTNGSFTLLVLSDNTLLTNSTHGIIGRNLTARSNEVQLISSTARWQMGGSLFVGSNGAMNRLVVSNGAFVNNNNGILGNGASSSNNLALVTGSGSFWSNRIDLTVGSFGSDNQLIISNGGRAASRIGNLGQQPGSSNNLVVVTGNGSSWTNHLDVNVGVGDRGNRLIIEAGGFVGGDNGRVGAGGSGGNEALVTGSGSVWSSRTDLAVGLNPPNNRLVVSNGAAVVAGGRGRLGASVPATGNEVIVTGAGSSWSNQFDLLLGEGSMGNRIEVNSGGWVTSSNTHIGNLAGSNLVLVTGTGSVFSNRADLFVGHSSGTNQLVVTGGARAVNRDAYLGFNAPANNNLALVTDSGTLWSNRNALTVGNLSDGNQLVVSNGATVIVAGDFVVGFAPSSASNSVTVTGAGTTLSAPLPNAFHYLGRNGSYNSLLVKDGARFNTFYGYQMGPFNSSNNVAIITGPGSSWTNSNQLSVGGGRDLLMVSNGAVLNTRSLRMDASRGVAIITGTGSTMPVTDSVLVGAGAGFSNRLVIEKGAVVTSSDFYIGAGGFSDGDRVLVTDPGSVLSNRFLVELSTEGAFGTELVVSNGAVLYSSSATMHGSEVSNGGCEVLVTGPGSTWNNQTTFRAGVLFHRNRLIISNGGTLFSGDGLTLGQQSGSTNNVFLVDGTLRATNQTGTSTLDVRRGTNIFNAGLMDVDRLLLTNSHGFFQFNGGTLITRGAAIANGAPFVVGRSGIPATWHVLNGSINHQLASRLIVGSNSSFNQVFITNGAVLDGQGDTFIAFTSGNGNVLTVSGPGSTLNSPLSMFIGADGNANRMIISDGGKVFANLGNAGTFIGRSVGTRSNAVIVADPDSQWSINDILYVGAGGNANLLVVSNGATVNSLVGYVGSAFQASNNLAIITGANSTWSNRSELYVGASGSPNRLVVEAGGTLITSNAFLATDLSSHSNIVEVTGPGTFWNNRADLFVGYDGTRNQVIVSNGATVLVGGTLLVGRNLTTSTANRLIVDGGTLLVTNGSGSGVLEIRRGTNVLNAGLIEADILRATNGAGNRVELNGGTLSVKSSRVSVGPPVIVGNGSPATFNLAGNGTHDFSGTLGLIVRSNAALTGNGSLIVQLQVQAGGQLAPGASMGKISLSTPPFLSGTTVMEISKDGAALTNDLLQVTGTLTYGGTLVVTNLGPTALAAGDRFKLFHGTPGYAGSFSSISLPPLAPGLIWVNNLLVDGSIEVLAPPAVGTGSALSFDGANDFVSVSHEPRFNAFPFLATAWIKTTQTNGEVGILNKYAAGSLNGWHVGLVNGQVRAWYIRNNANYVWDGGSGLNGGSVADGEWHHVAFSVDENIGYLYVDGFLKDSRAWTGTAASCTTTQDVSYARYPGGAGEFFNGSIDEIVLWSTAKDPLNIKTNIDRGLLGNEASLVAYYRANEGTGIAVQNASAALGTWHGILQNGVAWVPGLVLRPALETRVATIVTAASATLNGRANPNLTNTSAWFEWGTTTSYGNVTPVQFLGGGGNNTNFSQSITGLTENVTYHFRAVASNSAGVSPGIDRSFAATGTNMLFPRAFHTATLLPNGKVLATGGYDQNINGLSSAELFDPATGTWAPAEPMSVVRFRHTATLLSNGKVLVAGGEVFGFPLGHKSAELYDPVTGTWSPTGSMLTNRALHTTTLLSDGKVLVAGGSDNSSELYDPATGTWTATGPLSVRRSFHTATLLPNKTVLVAGGTGPSGTALSSAEVYDPISGSWTNTGSMSTNRSVYTATLLRNGKVLAVGGNSSVNFLKSAELYDPVAGTWTATGSMLNFRFQHTATLLQNGHVLASGLGIGVPSIYDPFTGLWTDVPGPDPGSSATATLLPGGNVLIAGGNANNPTSEAEVYVYTNFAYFSSVGTLTRARSDHTATLLPDNRVLVAGLTNSEIYNPVSFTWLTAPALNTPRSYHRATLLPDGKVLASGGFINGFAGGIASVERFDPAGGTWTTNGGLLATPRGAHTATLLANGKVLVTGGLTNGLFASLSLSSAELYNPANQTWTNTGSMSTNRVSHTATLLPNGKVLVAGGIRDPSFGGATSSAELYDPFTGTWTNTGSMTTNRSGHSATLLPSGMVLVAGGRASAFSPGYASAELYDPATGAWKSTGPMNNARHWHTATLLPGGKVLVARGYSFGYLSSAELYDPTLGTWTLKSASSMANSSHTATLLTDGAVLFAGGSTGSGPINLAELYINDLAVLLSPQQPQILTATTPLNPGSSLAITGAQFRGLSEGSGGSVHNSATDFPIIQLRSLENEQVSLVLPANWTSNSFTSIPVPGLPRGWAMATAFVNGIPSNSRLLNIGPATPTPFELTGTMLPGGGFQLGFTNTPNATFFVVMSLDASLPLNNWLVIGVVTETAPGQYQFTDPNGGINPQRFYRARSQ